MHIHTSVLCIFSFLFLLPLALSQIPDPCYGTITSASPFTPGTSSPPFFNPYPCSLAPTAYASDGVTTTYSIDAATCGAALSDQLVSYGDYECEMKPPGVAGTVMSCQVVSLNSAAYESVYIKFIGNDTKRVYIGFFGGGLAYQAGPYPLKFDASLEYHKYGFVWTSAYIIWYVDLEEVSSNYGNAVLPRTPNRFMTNLVTEVTGGVKSDTSSINTDVTVGRDFQALGTAVGSFRNISYIPLKSVSCDGAGIDGGGGNVDPNACDLRLPFIIYDDEAAEGWNNASSTSNTFISTANVRTGTYSIAWDVIPNARLNFFAPETFFSTKYQTFEFWIYGNGFEGQQIGVTMLFNDGVPSPTINIASLLPGLGVQRWKWVRVVAPFTLFGVSDIYARNVRGFSLSSLSDGFGGTVGIDDVSLGYLNPMCTNDSLPIYTDQLASGYSDLSYGTWTLRDPSRAHSGSYSIMWGLYGTGGSGLRFHGDGVDSGKFNGISMWLSVGSVQGWDWSIGMTNDDSTAKDQIIGSKVNVRNYYGGTANLPRQNGQWLRVVIPFSQFGIKSGTTLHGIVFARDDDAPTFQGTLYVDDISYIEQVSMDSSGPQIVAGLLGIFALCVVLL